MFHNNEMFIQKLKGDWKRVVLDRMEIGKGLKKVDMYMYKQHTSSDLFILVIDYVFK